MRVLTWNVQTDGGDLRRTALVGELRRLAPDVAALQEVRRDAGRDQLAELVPPPEALVAGTGLRHTTHQADLLGAPPPGAERFGGTAVAARRTGFPLRARLSAARGAANRLTRCRARTPA